MFARKELFAIVAASAASLAFCISSAAASATSRARCISITACFFSVTSVATPKISFALPSAAINGILLICSHRIAPSRPLKASSGIDFSAFDSRTAMSSLRMAETCSTSGLKSASVFPMSCSTVVPYSSARVRLARVNRPFRFFAKIRFGFRSITLRRNSRCSCNSSVRLFTRRPSSCSRFFSRRIRNRTVRKIRTSPQTRHTV